MFEAVYFMRNKKSIVISAFTPEANLKRKIRAHLRKLGFEKSNDGALMPPSSSKDTIRTLHQDQRNAILKTQRDFVLDMLPRLTRYFANGNEIDPTKIAPKIELIKADTWQAELFRLASLCWSVPVSAGFGRRLRYLVWDNHNDKLIGLMALGDPVFNLKVRDELVGWNVTDRSKRLVNILVAIHSEIPKSAEAVQALFMRARHCRDCHPERIAVNSMAIVADRSAPHEACMARPHHPGDGRGCGTAEICAAPANRSPWSGDGRRNSWPRVSTGSPATRRASPASNRFPPPSCSGWSI